MIIAYYTKDTPYEEEVKNLKESIELLGLDYRICGVKKRESWTANCAMKAEFIYIMLRKYECDLLYVDADARIRKDPFKDIDFSTFDLAAHYRRERELLSGTLFLSNTEATLNLLEEWMREQTPKEWDQQVLQRVIENNNVRVKRLPLEYTFIFDKMQGDPIIEHFQASRRFKNRC